MHMAVQVESMCSCGRFFQLVNCYSELHFPSAPQKYRVFRCVVGHHKMNAKVRHAAKQKHKPSLWALRSARYYLVSTVLSAFKVLDTKSCVLVSKCSCCRGVQE